MSSVKAADKSAIVNGIVLIQYNAIYDRENSGRSSRARPDRAALGAGRGIPILRRIAAPASAFCMLNAAVVVGFYKFLFVRGPLWKIWTPTAPASVAIKAKALASATALILRFMINLFFSNFLN